MGYLYILGSCAIAVFILLIATGYMSWKYRVLHAENLDVASRNDSASLSDYLYAKYRMQLYLLGFRVERFMRKSIFSAVDGRTPDIKVVVDLIRSDWVRVDYSVRRRTLTFWRDGADLPMQGITFLGVPRDILVDLRDLQLASWPQRRSRE
jgi:hypothetical protein